jgi:hypothetical protein
MQKILIYICININIFLVFYFFEKQGVTPCVPAQSGGRSWHASCVGAEWGWWRWGCSSSAERGAPEVAIVASKPPPRRWAWPGTQPQHSSGRWRSNALKTRRWGYCRGTQCIPMWTGVCPGNPPNPHQCTLSARRRQSIVGGFQNPGCPVDNIECASWRWGGALGDYTCGGRPVGPH